jgi:opacity protein-like surface antigen
MAHNGQRWRGLLVSACSALVLVAMPLPAAAQNPNPQSSGTFQAPSNPDFMLGRPRASVGFRGEWLFASAGSDIFDFVTEQLTIEKSSFNAPGFGAELGMVVTPRLDVVAGFDIAKSDTPSEYRNFVDNRLLPIQQITSLRQSNIFGSVKFAVIPRGRAISRFAWIPSTIVPYVGAGGGLTNYEFEQVGDFVDFADNSVFTESFRSSGWTPTGHVLGGADIQVYKRMFLSLEGRYTWAYATMDPDFIDFEPIDLGGFRFSAGIHVSF